jgi:hypothetical protein
MNQVTATVELITVSKEVEKGMLVMKNKQLQVIKIR